ncbi:hypothetical protein Hanom_Chr01g00025361 [Helianthus anomalus]
MRNIWKLKFGFHKINAQRKESKIHTINYTFSLTINKLINCEITYCPSLVNEFHSGSLKVSISSSWIQPYFSKNGLVRVCGGYSSILHSFHTFSTPSRSRTTSHMQLLHLNPAPKLTINNLSPFFSLFLASMYPKTYQTLLAEVLPNRCKVIRAGSTSYSLNPRL